MKVNYHTHTARCNHARGTEKEYVEAAIQNGIKILGFSDHTPYPFPGENYATYFRMDFNQLEDYVTTVLALKDEYQNDIEIHLGLEAEYYPLFFEKLLQVLSEYPIEYLLLGQHNLGNGESHEAYCYRAITDDPARLTSYCDQVIEGIDTGCFTYLAHPDLLSFNGDLEDYNLQMRRLCRHAAKTGLPLELNLLGLREGRRYPREDFWRIAGEEGCSVVLGLDSHDPESFSHQASLLEAGRLMKDHGLKLTDQITLINPFFHKQMDYSALFRNSLGEKPLSLL